jgi:RHS repeat-associated protein
MKTRRPKRQNNKRARLLPALVQPWAAFCPCIVERLEPRTLLSAILSGQSIAGDILTSGQLDTYTFNAAVGNTFEVSVGPTDSTSNYRSKVTVLGPNSSQVGTAATAFGSTSANVVYNVPSNGAGTYTVQVQSDVSADLGTYDLDLVVAPATQAVDSDGDGGVITSGQTKAGTINHFGDLDVYTFSAAAGNTVQLAVGADATSSNYRPEMTVYGPTGAQVATANNAYPDTAANITYNVPTGGDGTYTVVVQSDNAATLGTYDLDLVVAPAAQAADSNGDGGAITSGQTKAGSINHYGDLDVYTFSAAAGNIFQLAVGADVTSSNYRPEMTVYGPTGAQVATANNAYPDTGANITYDVPTGGDGTYTVVVQSDNVGTLGTYDLDLVIVPATQAPDSDGDGGAISSGQTKSGAINHYGDLDVYTFSAAAGNTFQLAVGADVTSSNFRPEMTVYGPTGAQVATASNAYPDTAANITYNVPTGGDGTYTVVVQSDNVGTLGTYDLDLVIVPATQAADSDGDGGVITSGQTKSGAINHYGDLDVYTFSAAAGNTFQLAVGADVTSSNYRPEMTVYGPTGAQVATASNAYPDTAANITYNVPTGGDGTYTVVVQSENIGTLGTYDLDLVIAPATQAIDSDGDGGVITSGQVKAGTINHYGDLDTFTFTAPAGNTFKLGLAPTDSSSNYRPSLTVYDSNGTQVAAASSAYATAVNTSYSVPTGDGGTFTAVVQSDNVSTLGTYDFEMIQGLTAGVITPGPLTSNVPLLGRINTSGGQDSWTFFGQAGNNVTVLLNPSTTTAANFLGAIAPALTWATVSLIAPDGNTVLATQTTTTAGQVLTLNGINLPTDGTYTVQVSAASTHSTSTGNYVLGVYNVTSNARPLNLNTNVIGHLAEPFTFDQYTFSAAANAQIQFNLASGSSGALTYTLTGPNGVSVFSNATASSGLLNLPADGTYTLTVQGVGGQVGSYAFNITATSQTALTLGVPFNGTTTGNGEAQLFTVPLTSSDPVSIALTDASAFDHNELYASFGHPPTRATYDYGVSATGASQNILIPTGKPTTLYVLVYGDVVHPAPGSFTLLVQSAPAVLTSATPDEGAANAPTTLTLTGAGFNSGAVVSLVAANNTVYPATSSTTDLPTQITASFAAGSVPAGTYSIQVAEGGTTTQLPNAFTMVASGQAILTAHLELPNPMTRHIAQTLYIDYANTGTVAMAAPLMVLTATNPLGQQGALFTLDPALRGIGLWTSATPVGFVHSIEILGNGNTPGILQPGESERIPVYYAGWLSSQWDFSSRSLNFSLEALQTTDTTPIDWAAQQSAFQPTGISTTAWNAIYGSLLTQLGNTAGGYVQMLDNQAQYLGRLGENVTDVASLWNFAFQQANNSLSPAAPYLTSSTDDALPTPGDLSLSFNRMFAQTIVGRDTPGPLGMGWSTPWQTSATIGTDGTVLINEPGGGVQIFQPDSRYTGVYLSQPGDTNTLSADGRGGYLLTEVGGMATDYTSAGLMNYLQDRDGNRITAGYTAGKLTTLTASSGQSLTIAYNTAGLISSVTDSAGGVATYTYDGTNTYLTSFTGTNGQTTSYAYNTTSGSPSQNALTTITLPGGAHEFFSYDSQGRLSGISADNNIDQQTLAYALGKVSVTDGAGDTSSLYYNENGLVRKTVDALGNPTYYGFNSSFNLTSVTNALGQSVSYTYNTLGQLTSSTDLLGNVTNFTYGGPLSQLTTMTDAKGNTTTYQHNASGDLLQTTYADGTSNTATFDPEGNALSFVNGRGQATTYTYNSAGLLTQETFADATSYSYTYDARGDMLTATDASGTTIFTYDPTTGVLTHVAYPDTTSLTFTYNAAGQRTQMVDQSGFTTNYHYDAAGRLASLTDGGGNAIVTYTYDAAGRLATKTNGNGTTTTYAYDAAGNILHIVNLAPNASVDSRFDYTYNALGLETSQTTIDGQWSYTYDLDGQLTHAVFTVNGYNRDGLTNQDLTYNYDALGNRTSTVINGITTNYVVNNMNEYTSVGGVTYAYDADGNLTSDGTNTYTYNSLNELTGIAGASTSTYAYNALGWQISSTIAGQTTHYMYDPLVSGQVVATLNGANNILAHFVYGIGLVSQVTNASFYYAFDALGSTSEITDSTGTIVSDYAYLPFGALTISPSAIANMFKFVGERGVIDAGNGVYNMHARFYLPNAGVFLSIDPLDAAGGDVNLRRYVSNSPTRLIDPSGLEQELVDANDVIDQAKDIIRDKVGGAAIDFAKKLEAMDAFKEFKALGLNNGQAFQTLRQDIASIGELKDFKGGFGLSTGLITAGFDIYNGDYGKALLDGGSSIAVFLNPELDIPAFFLGLGIYAGEHWIPDELIESIIVGYWNAKDFVIDSYNKLKRYLENDINSLKNLLDEAIANVVNAIDPNSIAGPTGFGTSNFIAANGQTFPYTVNFENSSTATAPAQSVTITSQLDPNLDWSTFALSSIGFGDTRIDIPAGSQHYQTTVPITYNGETFDVDVEAGIDTATGQVFATFQSVDPNTGLPPADPLTGFLPPEDGTGRGDGFLSYTISPKAGLATGTQIRSVADITFDDGVTIATNQVSDSDPSQGIDPTKEALVTIDAGVPTSSVSALPATQTATGFNVTWSGADDTNGSGIAGYTIYVSDNGGTFIPWLVGTTATSAVYTGIAGHIYGFFSVAVDNAGNVQATPGSAQASTGVNSNATQTTTVTVTAGKPNILLAATETLTATVASPAGTPVGAVTFFDGTTSLGTVALTNGAASLDISTLAFGDHAITATYNSLITSAPLNVFVGNTSNEVIVNALYRQLLARNAEITQSGLLYWAGRLDNGDSLSVVADGIATSVEYDSDIVTGIYEQYLHRGTDPTGLHNWVAQMQAGTISYEQIRGYILGSQEFQNDAINQYGDYVTGLYQVLLGRNPDPTGTAYWNGILGTLTSNSPDSQRDPVSIGISTSFEQYEDFVGTKFNQFLNRNPSAPTAASLPAQQYVTPSNPNGIPPPTDPVSQGEQGFWADALNHGTTDGDFIADILSSSEYLHDQGLQ